MKITGLITIVSIGLYAALALLQVWFKTFSPETFVKISVTFAIVVGTLGISAIIRREYVQEEKQRKEGYID